MNKIPKEEIIIANKVVMKYAKKVNKVIGSVIAVCVLINSLIER